MTDGLLESIDGSRYQGPEHRSLSRPTHGSTRQGSCRVTPRVHPCPPGYGTSERFLEGIVPVLRNDPFQEAASPVASSAGYVTGCGVVWRHRGLG